MRLEQLKKDIKFVAPTRKGFNWLKGTEEDGGFTETSQPDYVKEVWVDQHPEGADRGGYVVWVALDDGKEVYFHESDYEWETT